MGTNINYTLLELDNMPLSQRQLEWSLSTDNFIPDQFTWNNFDLLDQAFLRKPSSYAELGEFSKLEAIFLLRRQPSYFLIDTYLPSALFVMASWSSFWIDIPAAPARVALVLTTMLTHVTSTKTAHNSLPRVSYVHSMDIWDIGCTRKLPVPRLTNQST